MGQNPRTFQRYRVAIEYIGTRFSGAQQQTPNCRTSRVMSCRFQESSKETGMMRCDGVLLGFVGHDSTLDSVCSIHQSPTPEPSGHHQSALNPATQHLRIEFVFVLWFHVINLYHNLSDHRYVYGRGEKELTVITNPWIGFILNANAGTRKGHLKSTRSWYMGLGMDIKAITCGHIGPLTDFLMILKDFKWVYGARRELENDQTAPQLKTEPAACVPNNPTQQHLPKKNPRNSPVKNSMNSCQFPNQQKICHNRKYRNYPPHLRLNWTCSIPTSRSRKKRISSICNCSHLLSLSNCCKVLLVLTPDKKAILQGVSESEGNAIRRREEEDVSWVSDLIRQDGEG
ncbi:hypothetical protein LXL04_033995 [Taraxacum kok-saghyz]